MPANGSNVSYNSACRDYTRPPDRADRRLFPPEVAAHAVKIACERPDTCGRSLCLWDCQEIARHLCQVAGIPSISAQTVQRMLAAHKRKPWRKQMWLSPKVPRDAVFAEKVRRLCDLYTRPLGEHERVISTDEHPSLQPRPRLHPTRPALPGRPTQVEHEYKRCGALNLWAALDTRSGQVWGEIAPRKRQVEFIALLEQIDADLPESVTKVYVILDNVRMHTGQKGQEWLQKPPRFEWVHPPVPCSWLNQIEQWFSILVRKRLKIADFASKEHLRERLQAFIREWNERAHGFRWTTKSFEKILAKCEPAMLKAA
jgi:transposase